MRKKIQTSRLYRNLSCFLVTAAAAFAQFSGLATNDDGSHLYYTSQIITPGREHVLQTRILRISPDGNHTLAERWFQQMTASRTNHYLLSEPTVTGDGTIVAFNATGYCNVGSGCSEPRSFPETRAVIRKLSDAKDLDFDGHVRVSRGGRFALLYDFGDQGGSHAIDLWDSTTSLRTSLYLPHQASSSGKRASIASDGTVVLVDNGELVLLQKGEVRVVRTSTLLEEAVIDDRAQVAVCLTRMNENGASMLIEVDLTNGRERHLTETVAGLSKPLLSADGRLVLYLASADRILQAFVLDRLGQTTRRITSVPEGIAEAVLSGNGVVAYVLAGRGNTILRVDLGDELKTRLLEMDEEAGQKAGSRNTTLGTGIGSAIQSPTPGSRLNGSTAVFTWTLGTNLTAHRFLVGTSPGASDVYFYEGAPTTGRTVTNLPVDGRSIHVRLASRINGIWESPGDYIYTAFDARAVVLTPAPGSKSLTGSSVTIAWSSVAGVAEYKLQVGTEPGSQNIAVYQGTSNSFKTPLPQDGRNIYVYLSSRVGTGWLLPRSYTYTVYDARASILTPAPLSTFSGTSQRFEWSPGSGVARYHLAVGSTVGANDLYDYQGTLTYATAPSLPVDGRTIYVRLWSCFSGSCPQQWAVVNYTSASYRDYRYSSRPPVWSLSAPATPRPSIAGSYAVDNTLATPNITSVTGTDNAAILTWQDTNTTHNGYMIIVWDRSTSIGPTEFRFERDIRGVWIVDLIHGMLIPGTTLDIHLMALSPVGVSKHSAASVTLTAPTIRIGDPSTGATVLPTAFRAFAPWDRDRDGFVAGAEGSGGVFPLFQDSSGGQPVARLGDQFDRIPGGIRANVVAAYFMNESNLPRFVGFHLFIDPMTTRSTPVSVLYGDAQANVPGTLVWVSPSVETHSTVVTTGDAALNVPNIVEGTVTASVLAANGTFRVVEFSFRLALLPV